MPAIITNKFRVHNAEQFKESFGEAADTYYLGIGRPQPFADNQAFNDGTDANPPTPNDDIGTEYYIYDDLLSAKKISTSDVSIVIPRRNWTTGTVYDYYRHDYGNINSAGSAITSDSGASNLFDSTFYVLTSTYDVYKCIDNNSGAASTVEPSANKNTSTFSTADGYVWKYMYSLTADERQNFLSTDFMHVSTESTDYSTTAGALELVKITDAGSGGSDGTYSGVTIRGDGSGGTADVTVSSGAITDVTITAVGSGYTYASLAAGDIGSVSGYDVDFIISPEGGHAKDCVKELGGFFVMMNVNFVQAEGSGDFNTENDFRRIVMLRNPTDSTTGSTATADTLDATRSITFSSTSGDFQVDEKITQTTTNAVGYVVDWNSSTKVLRYIQPQFTDQGVNSNGDRVDFSGTSTVTGGTSGVTGTPSSHDITPELTADSGDVLYIENRKPIIRAADQTENVKLIVEF